MRPDDFWRLSPGEFWLIYDVRKPPEMIGKMRADTFEKLKGMLDAKPR